MVVDMCVVSLCVYRDMREVSVGVSSNVRKHSIQRKYYVIIIIIIIYVNKLVNADMLILYADL
jgi:hypothetical protein